MPEKTMRVNADGGSGNRAPMAEGQAAVVLIYATFPDRAAAEAIGGALVEARLAACVNVLPGLTSIYSWQGETQKDEEVAVVIKTRAVLAARVMGWVRVAHAYVNPALVVLPAVGGSQDFLAWIEAETSEAVGRG